MQAFPVPGKETYGIQGSIIVQLPVKPFIQFQGGAELIDGVRNNLDFYLMLEIKDVNNEWIPDIIFPCKGLDIYRENNPGICYFKENLTKWAGREIRLSLVLRANPEYIKVGNVEKWIPNTISVNIFSAEIVTSDFNIEWGDVSLSQTDKYEDPQQSVKKLNIEKHKNQIYSTPTPFPTP